MEMENSTPMSKEKEKEMIKEEPKTLSKKELAALRDAAKALLKIQERPEDSIQVFLKGESSAGQSRPASKPSG